MSRVAHTLAAACSLAGIYTLHRLGPDGRRFVADMTTGLTTRRNQPWLG